jgi:hypothetical protein
MAIYELYTRVHVDRCAWFVETCVCNYAVVSPILKMIKNLHNFSCKDDTTRKEATERGKGHMGANKIFPL